MGQTILMNEEKFEFVVREDFILPNYAEAGAPSGG